MADALGFGVGLAMASLIVGTYRLTCATSTWSMP